MSKRQDRSMISWLVIVMITAAPLMVAACGSDDEGSGDGSGGDFEKVAISIYARDNPFFAQVVDGVEHAAEELGIEAEVTYAENDPAQQIDQIENIVTTQPSGLIVAPIDQNAIIPAMENATEAGIPVVTVADDVAEEGQNSRIAYLGNDYEQTGRDKAQFIVDQLNGKGTVAAVHLIRGLAFTEQQWDGASEVFAEHPGIEIVGEDYAGGAASNLGLESAENFLTANPDLDALYVDNDDLALGAVHAAKQQGTPMDEITIVGANGTPDAIESVAAGDLDMSVSFCGFEQGARAVRALYEYVVEGTDPPGPLETINVTADNLKKVEPDLGPGCNEPEA